jgi:hypothetical protein
MTSENKKNCSAGAGGRTWIVVCCKEGTLPNTFQFVVPRHNLAQTFPGPKKLEFSEFFVFFPTF